MGFYSPSEFIKNVWSFVLTKAFYPKARLIRRPVYIRGGKGLCYGSGFTTGYRCRFDIFENGKLILGADCKLGDQVHIVASDRVQIGDHCLAASNIFISDTNHGTGNDDPMIPPDQRVLSSAPVSIGKNVWIGESVCILPGAVIGDGCILGAHSVIKGEIPSYTVAVGAPAKVVKQYDFEKSCWERV